MNSAKLWQNANNDFFLRDISQTTPSLEPAIYSLEITGLGELYLHYLEDQFKFEFKLYGLENKFINKCIRTYNATTGNMGVLLNGVKGTGRKIYNFIF